MSGTLRVEPVDLLEDRDRLEEEAVLGEVLGDLLVDVDRLVDAVHPDEDVAEAVEGVGVVGRLLQGSAILLDGSVELAAGRELVGLLHDLLTLHRCHQRASSRSHASTRIGANVRRCRQHGPRRASASRCSGRAVADVALPPVAGEATRQVLHLGGRGRPWPGSRRRQRTGSGASARGSASHGNGSAAKGDGVARSPARAGAREHTRPASWRCE